MPRYRIHPRGKRRVDPRRRELADIIDLLDVLTTRPTPVEELMRRLGWRGQRLRTAIEALRQRGLRIITADQLTARLATPADSDNALDLLEKLAPRRLES